jgi:hypothetical protein
MYGRLLKFVEKNGHASPRVDDPVLGWWTVNQRYKNRKGIVSTEKKGLLEELVPQGWTWNDESDRVERQREWLEKIESYYTQNGHLNIPLSEKGVGPIATMIRRAYTGKKEYQSIDKGVFDRLNQLHDKGWMWDVTKELLLEKIKFLRKWCIENNSAAPHRSTKCQGNVRTYSHKSGTNIIEIGNLASDLRLRYRIDKFRDDPEYRGEFSAATLAKKRLEEEVVKEVEDIPGWYWDSWDGFARVYRRCHEEGIEIANQTVVDFDLVELRKIGMWVMAMRARALRGELKTHQIMSLESLPGWTYHARHDRFMRGVGHFIEFTKGKPDKNVALSTVLENGFRLGGWVNRTRQARRRGKLSAKPHYAKFYEKLLTDYGFVWEPTHEEGSQEQ